MSQTVTLTQTNALPRPPRRFYTTLRLRNASNRNNVTRRNNSTPRNNSIYDMFQINSVFQSGMSCPNHENNAQSFQQMVSDVEFGTESFNIGQIQVEHAQTKARFYLTTFPFYFLDTYDSTTDPADVFGVLFHFPNSPPIALDFSTALQDTMFDSFLEIIDETNEPIYLLRRNGASKVSPEDMKTKYKYIFNKTI
jgi:hypothetical protein